MIRIEIWILDLDPFLRKAIFYSESCELTWNLVRIYIVYQRLTRKFIWHDLDPKRVSGSGSCRTNYLLRIWWICLRLSWKFFWCNQDPNQNSWSRSSFKQVTFFTRKLNRFFWNLVEIYILYKGWTGNFVSMRWIQFGILDLGGRRRYALYWVLFYWFVLRWLQGHKGKPTCPPSSKVWITCKPKVQSVCVSSKLALFI